MDPIPKSGFTLPNRLARLTLLSLEELLTPDGMQSLLQQAHLPELAESYPAANLESGFDFADFGAINLGLEELYGPRGGRGMALRAGRKTFAEALGRFGDLAGLEATAFKLLPAGRRLRLGLSALARVYNEISDQQSSVKETRDAFHYIVHRNACCWGRSGEDHPVCFMMVGVLEEALHRISGGREFRVDEAECQAAGARQCTFVIHKEPID